MRHRALKDLLQLGDDEFLSAVADGLEALLENAEQFYIDSERIAKYGRSPGFGVLRGIAEEEAAKCLILIDAVRCPLTDQKQRRRQLGYFYYHLARGIYAEVAAGPPETFGELRAFVDELRQTLFLGGPDGYNYIYRNRILERRETRIYVDYEESDGDHYWNRPLHNDPSGPLILGGVVPPALQLVRDLRGLGLMSEAGLKLIADKWRAFNMTDGFSVNELRSLNRETCEAVLAGQDSEIADGMVLLERAAQCWQYPMHGLDLAPARVAREELQGQRLRRYLREFDPDVS